MIAATWPWALLGILLLLVIGILVMLLLGLLGAPADYVRRLGQSVSAPPTERGAPLPDEVPTATAEETTRDVDDVRSEGTNTIDDKRHADAS